MAFRTPTPELGLRICIFPRAYTRYYGNAEQLVAEGLIPPDFQWPSGRDHAHYELGRFSGFLCRCRPPGLKGPMRLWMHGDYWCLQYSLTSTQGQGLLEHVLYEKRQDMLDTLHRHTPEWSREWWQLNEARREPHYAAFLAQLLGTEQRGRGRPAKPTTPASTQGAAA